MGSKLLATELLLAEKFPGSDKGTSEKERKTENQILNFQHRIKTPTR